MNKKMKQVPNMSRQPKSNVHQISRIFKSLVNSFLPQQNPDKDPESVMCKTKNSVDATTPPSSRHNKHRKQPTPTTSTDFEQPTPSKLTTNTTSTSSSSSHSSRRSLSSIRSSLPENPHLYDISEIRTATNNFLSKSFSTSSRCWRCKLHGKDVLIFQRKSQHPRALRKTWVRQKLFSICKSHHVAIVNLLGASISGDYIYLVYDFINGVNLYDLLHNKNNPNFTVMNTWMSRMQVATDLANGLDYIHNNTGLDVTFVHNRIKSTSVIVTEPWFNAKICHFGTAVLCGEPTEEIADDYLFDDGNTKGNKVEEIIDAEDEDEGEEKGTSLPKKLSRVNSMKFNGTTGYMSPEFQMTGVGTRKSDVYAFGVVLVELLSGEEAVKYKYNKVKKEYVKVSAVDAAREVVADSGGGKLRKWVDSRLNDSYPVEVAEKLIRIAVECLREEADKRPDMRRVAGKISKLYLESQAWCQSFKIPTDITVSFAPR